jgi:hypothetical protein
MKKKVVDARLPGRFGKMTAEELDAEVAQYDEPFVAIRQSKPLTAADRTAHRRARRKASDAKNGAAALRVLITVEKSLLRRADSYARSKGISRSELIAKGLQSLGV